MSADEQLRVVMCTPGFPASLTDADKPFLLNHAIALSQAGIEVTVVSPAVAGSPARQLIENVQVVRVRYAPRRFETLAATGSMYREAKSVKGIWALPMMVAMANAAIREAKKRSAVIYGHWWIPGGLVAAIAAGWVKCPSVIHYHGSDAAITQNLFMRAVARKVARRVDLRLAVSEELAEWVRNLSRMPTEIIPMPVVAQLPSVPSSPPDDGYVLAVGRLVHEKGFDVLIDAVGQMDEKERPELIILGTGPERNNLIDRARKRSVPAHFPGQVPPHQMGDWYDGARLVAVPSRREGFGLVAAEAAAMERTVVGTTVGGIPTVVQDGVSGMLVEPEDVEALKDALRTADPLMGRAGPPLVEQLSVQNHGLRIRQLCEDLLN